MAVIFCSPPSSEAAAPDPPAPHLSLPLALPAQWSQPTSLTHQATSAQPVVAIAGQSVFMAWQEYSSSQGSNHYLAYSPDGGQTWGPKWSPTFSPPINFYSIYPHALAVDPQSNTLYLAYAAGEVEGSLWYFVTRSLDGGRTWTELPVPEIRDVSSVSLTIDQSGRLYLAWNHNRPHLAGSSDGGQSWTDFLLSDNDYINYTGIATTGNGRIFLLRHNSVSGQRWLSRSDDAGQSWTNLTPPDEMMNSYSVGIATAGPEEVYLMGRFFQDERLQVRVAVSQDGGVSWGAPALVSSLTDGLYPQVAARGQGGLTALWQVGAALYLAESENAGQSWSEAALLDEDFFLVMPSLIADPTSGNALVAWNKGDGQIWLSTSTSAAPANCPAVELLSARRLNEHTIGVVGLLDMNLGITSASLSAEGATSVDILTLARHNAPSGGDNPSGEQRWPGLWSASLYNPNGFGSTVSVGVEAIVPTIPDCVEPSLAAPVASPVHIQSIRATGANPDQDGVAVKVTTSDGSLPTVVLSRYQPGETGLNGAWQPILTTVLQADGNLFVPGEFVNPGENLYRVMVGDQAGVEDVDGFFTVPVTQDLTTNEQHQRRQALVFRDAIRRELGSSSEYTQRYSEQLLVAIGAQEGGGVTQTYSGFSNEGNGIMQITKGSGHKGETECGQNSDCLDNYSYTSNARSINFNAQDGLLVIDEAYNRANTQDNNNPRCYVIENQGEIDVLITAIVYYNKGCLFIDKYKTDPTEANYLGAVANQLQHYPENGNSLPPVGNNLSISEFLADADYTPEITDIASRLQCGQEQVSYALQAPGSSFPGCQ